MWIACKDKMPGIAQKIILALRWPDGQYTIAEGEYQGTYGWIRSNGSQWAANGDITHWQPLPPPPSQEK